MKASRRAWLRGLPVLRGLLPVRRSMIGGDVTAGLTLAALGIPEVIGYARIAGMPVETGLYTLLLPMAAFAVLGASRHLVVGADSATAAILAAALTGLAAAGSPQYVRLAGLAALLAGGLLLLARVARLGFLANFLSRTVLVGFLTGVGIQVAISQLPDMFGVTVTGAGSGPGAVIRFIRLLIALPRTQPWDVAISAGVIAVMLAARLVNRHIPGALIALAGAIILSHSADLDSRGVATVGPVPHALPSLGLTDLPIAALAAVVFLIGVGLVDVAGMRRLMAVRPTGFAVALVTAVAVVVLGVRNGIILAIAVSIIDHLRHTYHPLNSVLVKSATGHWEAVPVDAGARTEPGLVVYRFGTSLYYANASRLLTDVDALAGVPGPQAPGEPLRWLVLDGVAIGDVDYTAGLVLSQVIEELHDKHVFIALSGLLDPVRRQLDRYGIRGKDGPNAYYQTAGEALEA